MIRAGLHSLSPWPRRLKFFWPCDLVPMVSMGMSARLCFRHSIGLLWTRPAFPRFGRRSAVSVLAETQLILWFTLRLWSPFHMMRLPRSFPYLRPFFPAAACAAIFLLPRSSTTPFPRSSPRRTATTKPDSGPGGCSAGWSAQLGSGRARDRPPLPPEHGGARPSSLPPWRAAGLRKLGSIPPHRALAGHGSQAVPPSPVAGHDKTAHGEAGALLPPNANWIPTCQVSFIPHHPHTSPAQAAASSRTGDEKRGSAEGEVDELCRGAVSRSTSAGLARPYCGARRNCPGQPAPSRKRGRVLRPGFRHARRPRPPSWLRCGRRR